MENIVAQKPSRSIAIDAFRAVTMVLMIFVNDMTTLINVPNGLRHVKADVDGMGLADVVFPVFLFIVGLSVPYAIQSRKKHGDSDLTIWSHIIFRTAALLMMGVLFVNYETFDSESALVSKHVWVTLLIVGFFLIWMDYKEPKRLAVRVLKVSGIAILIFLGVIYKSTSGASGIMGLTPQWWGILGKIGWAYFTAGTVCLFSREKLWVAVAAFVFLLWFNSAANLGWLQIIKPIKPYVWIVADGAPAALTMGGLIAGLLYKKYGIQQVGFWLALLAFSVSMFVFGFATRPLWGISKIHSTLSWVAICTAISLVSFLIFTYLTDVQKLTKWYEFIKPAGVATLTCYLIPYVHYALINITGVTRLPDALRDGGVGLVKAFLYALLVVFFVGWLIKKNIKLKL